MLATEPGADPTLVSSQGAGCLENVQSRLAMPSLTIRAILIRVSAALVMLCLTFLALELLAYPIVGRPAAFLYSGSFLDRQTDWTVTYGVTDNNLRITCAKDLYDAIWAAHLQCLAIHLYSAKASPIVMTLFRICGFYQAGNLPKLRNNRSWR